jgi:hypothetical protein
MKKKKTRKNLFDRATIGFYDLVEFQKLYVLCSKLAISTKLKAIPPFPKIKILLNPDKNIELDHTLLANLKDFFDEIKVSKPLAVKIVDEGGENVRKVRHNKRDLSKKRDIQYRLLHDEIIKSKEQYGIDSVSNHNAFKVYYNTIVNSMLKFPPSIINQIRFESYMNSLNEKDTQLMKNVYTKVGHHYCAQNRINKNNWKELSWIIFKIKHCPL